ncbi:MAG TPA: hypothetical protein VNW97_12375 [Candidatus Saccharimonadales bacterium]|nr:hypothetical protein [Candidatus Saccharimonadales bacterium]
MHDRVFPVTHGEWSWWTPVLVFGAMLFVALLGAVPAKLSEKPWWHTVLLVPTILIPSSYLADRAGSDGFLAWCFNGFIPVFSVVGFAYLALVEAAERRKHRIYLASLGNRK